MSVPLRLAIALLAPVLVALLPSGAGAAQSTDAQLQSFDRALRNAADQLDAAAQVRPTPGTRGTVPNLHLPPAPLGAATVHRPSLDQWLRAELDRIREERSTAQRVRDLAQLALSLRRVARPGTSLVPKQDPDEESLAILAGRAYQTRGAGPAPKPHQSLLQKIVTWLEDRLSELIQRIFGATASRPVIGQIVAVLFVALVAAAAAYLIFVLASLVIVRTKFSTPEEGTPLRERVDAEMLHRLAATAASQGHYAQAVSLLFQASLASFDAAGKLPYDASLTAGEYRHAVRRSVSSASSYFDDIAGTFVLAAFAERPISREEFTAADSAYRSLRSLTAT